MSSCEVPLRATLFSEKMIFFYSIGHIATASHALIKDCLGFVIECCDLR